MSYYLVMDGVDDRLSIPTMTATEFILEMKPRPQNWEQYINFGGKNINSTGSNTDAFHADYQAVYVDGISVVTNTAFVKRDTRQIMRGVLKPSLTTSSSTYVFWNGAAAYMEGEIFSLKIYNEDVLQAHYDMSIGTVQDVSGNGRHATLTGGTWIDDGQGGGTEPEPTPISIQFPTRQTIFKPISVNVNTEQSIFKNVSESYSTTQAIYKQINTSHLTNQQIYKSIAEQFGTKQIVSKLITEQFNTKQSIYKRVSFDFPIGIVITALTNYVASFPTEQIIYKQIVSDSPTKQSIYKSIVESVPTQQNIFKQTSYEFKTAQQIFKRVINDAAIRQVIYKHVSDNNPLQIRIIIPGAPELIGVIRLQGKRELFAYLQGKRELTIHLKGGLNMIKNQNFSMISGDTKTIVIDINENLVGAAAKWSMKKRGATTTTLIKNGSVADGKIQIVLDKADTEELSGLFMHECEVTDQSGNVSTVTSGAVNIQADMI